MDVASTTTAPSPSVAGIRLTERQAEQVVFVAGYYQWQRDELDELAAAEQEAAVLQEEFIYSCMRGEGFEYFVRTIGTIVWMPGYSIEPESRDWLEIYGIGFSTTLLPQAATGVAVGYLGDAPIPPDISEDSDETRYLRSLSPEEHRQYSLVLSGFESGQSIGPGTVLSPEQQERADRSCQGQAEERHPSPPSPVDIDDGTGELVQRVLASADWLRFTSEGWACVRDTGLEVSSVAQVERLIEGRLTDERVYERLGELSSELEPIPDRLAEDLRGVQEYERELAETLWDCGVHPIQERWQFVALTESFVRRS